MTRHSNSETAASLWQAPTIRGGAFVSILGALLILVALSSSAPAQVTGGARKPLS